MATFATSTRALATPLQASRRRRILQQPLTPAQREVYDMSLEQWRHVAREQLAGYHCRVPAPVPVAALTPVDAQHPLLRRIAVYRGPVTALAVEAIVNAANEVCLGGGGVDGAIHALAGPLLQRECAQHPGCATGQCICTKGYDLPARYVLHTVGPVGEQPALLRSCYASVFALAARNKLRSIGLCGVSTGVYGYPLQPAMNIAVDEALRFVREHGANDNDNDGGGGVDVVCFACFHEPEARAVETALMAATTGDAHM